MPPASASPRARPSARNWTTWASISRSPNALVSRPTRSPPSSRTSSTSGAASATAHSLPAPELLASEFDLLAARIGILSETIATYLEIDHLRRQVAIASEQVGVLREREQLAERRYERGLSSSAEYYAVRRARNGAEAGVPLIENQLAEAESRLAVLLGGYRDDVEAILPDSARPEPATDPVPGGDSRGPF